MNAEIIRINENTYRIENGFVRFFLLQGREKALLIDTGAACPDAKEIAESLTTLPITLINTHGDGDHTSGNAAFDEFIITREDYENCRIREKFPSSRPVFPTDGEIIDLGRRKIEIVFIPGHTKGSIALLDVEERVLYSGDSVQNGNIYMFGAHRDTSAFLPSLEKLERMSDRFDLIYPCHGDPVLGSDYLGIVEKAWKKVISGEVIPCEESLHGFVIHRYDCDGCGFYMSK